jgi:hypothetical protein
MLTFNCRMGDNLQLKSSTIRIPTDQFGFQHAAALGEHIDGRLFSLWPLEGEGPAVAHANVDLDGDQEKEEKTLKRSADLTTNQVASLLVDHIAMA